MRPSPTSSAVDGSGIAPIECTSSTIVSSYAPSSNVSVRVSAAAFPRAGRHRLRPREPSESGLGATTPHASTRVVVFGWSRCRGNFQQHANSPHSLRESVRGRIGAQTRRRPMPRPSTRLRSLGVEASPMNARRADANRRFRRSGFAASELPSELARTLESFWPFGSAVAASADLRSETRR